MWLIISFCQQIAKLAEFDVAEGTQSLPQAAGLWGSPQGRGSPGEVGIKGRIYVVLTA